MILIKSIEIKNYKNIKQESFNDFKDFNILIGPNNCGKSNILIAINLLSSEFKIDKSSLVCDRCNELKDNSPIRENIVIPFDKKGNSYMNKGNTEIKFTFSDDGINIISPETLNDSKRYFEEQKNTRIHIQEYYDKLTLKFRGNQLRGEHLSMYLHPKILTSLKKNVLFCPEARLQTYKGDNFTAYITKKKFTTTNFRKWLLAIQELVDPKIVDNRTADLDREYEEGKLTTTIDEQGSGVRSIVCLLADILDEKDQKIILIDEPELGLNPFAKQCFLSFLLEISKEKQIFIATQDPTFINPTIWKSKDVGLYLYSSYNQKFVKTEMIQGTNNPHIFAGFLPHTVSLKNIHLYFEGPSDVYIFQILLKKFLEEKLKGPRRRIWLEFFNKVGMYHLCGDFWKHLLYTIPKSPYKCMIILDGDKKTVVPEILEQHNNAKINASPLKFCKDVSALREIFDKGEEHPVYCLKKDCIEKYLYGDFEGNSPYRGYSKKIDGPKKAEKLTELPDEMQAIFEILFKN